MFNLDDIKFSVFGKQPHEELTPDQEFSLQALDTDEPHTDYIPDLEDAETRETLSSLWQFDDQKEKSWQRLEQKLNALIQEEKEFTIPVQRSKRFTIKWISITVAASLLIAFATWKIFFNQPVQEQTAKKSNTTIPDITPGEKNASLFLSDNRTISVKSDESKFPVQEKGALISKSGDSMIAYTLSVGAKQPFFNELVTLPKQEFGVKLPDGTIAWLNNGSTLRYPATFIHKDSAVTLSGEAYFEVNKNRSTPFRVNTLQNTQVIANGTKFNIKAYDDDSTVHTTLIEGSVWVRAGNDSTILKKGQQVITNKGVLMPPGNLADMTGVLAWKNGDINFEGENIRSVMKQITRWYGVEVDVLDNVQMDSLVGSIPRKFNLNKVIEKIKEVDQSLQFEWIEKDRKLIVSESTD